MRDNIQDLYGTNVPNHIEKLGFWIRRYPDKQIYEINENESQFPTISMCNQNNKLFDIKILNFFLTIKN